MGQQAGRKFARGVINQSTFVDAAVVGFVMLEAEVGDVIAERVEEVIVAVVVRAEEFLRLIDQILVVIPGFLRGVERCRAVGGDVHFGDGVLRERDYLQKFSGDDGGIDERGKRCGCEVDFVATLTCDWQRRAELPSVGNFQRGGVVDVVGLVALGIEQKLIPAEEREFVGSGGTGGESLFKSCGREKVQFGGNFADAGGNVDVNGEAVE